MKKHEIEKENADPDPKKKRLSLSLKKKSTADRFGRSSLDELEAKATKTMAKNSALSSKWALKNLNEWYKVYNERNSKGRVHPFFYVVLFIQLTFHSIQFLQ